jgi:Yip1 domain
MLVERMIRAARLDPELYREVVRDWYANGQAFLVVLIAFACTLIGMGPAALLLLLSPFHLISMTVMSIGNWLFWVFIAQLVGMRWGGRSDFEQLMRPVGFAHAPGVLRVLTLVTPLALPVSLIVFLWTAVAEILAVREAMQFPLGKALGLVLMTTLVILVIDAAIGYVTGRVTGVTDLLLYPFGR